MGNELVKLDFSEQSFQVEEKVEPFFIWDTRKCIVWILSLQIGNQLGKFMVVSEMLHGIRKGFPAYNGREMSIWLSMAIEELVIIVLKSS